MAVQPPALERMTAEELLDEMARPDIGARRRARVRERLVEMHQWLVTEVTRRYSARGEPVDDLRQAAYLGLVKAINGFDASLGHEFRGYAAVTVSGEVKRHFRDRTWAVRVPRLFQERRAELKRATADLTQELGRAPTAADLATRMGLSQEEVLRSMDASAAYSTLSLDAPVGDDSGGGRACLGDLIPDRDTTLDTMIDAAAVRPLVAALPDRERHILLLRFYGNMTQAEIAAEFGISQMHVSRILRGVLTQLRESLDTADTRTSPTSRTAA
ncbi:SigB/SigF/SigG family RNA polymerase sigma factor [Nonomuraea fuscirosea]|uniref:SigB/SigF/SigG family RNA polymerase sigma factor n=1 Tax=Nonomuraea fuscirosea TaxID=1291556 RepID=UPI0034449C49